MELLQLWKSNDWRSCQHNRRWLSLWNWPVGLTPETFYWKLEVPSNITSTLVSRKIHITQYDCKELLKTRDLLAVYKVHFFNSKVRHAEWNWFYLKKKRINKCSRSLCDQKSQRFALTLTLLMNKHAIPQ